MIRYSEQNDELTIDYYPINIILFLVVGFIVLLLLAMSFADYRFAFVLIGFIAVGCAIAAFMQITTTKINKKLKTVSIYRHGIIRKSFQSFQFDELVPGITAEAIPFYCGNLELKTGQKIRVFSAQKNGESIFSEMVDLANRYLLDLDNDDFKLTLVNNEGSFLGRFF
jgi:hypothetical protein